MGELLSYTTGASIMLTTYGMIRHLCYFRDIENCSRYNIQAGLTFGFVSGALVVRNAWRS